MIIVVPVYKSTPTHQEKKAMLQALSVLSRYPLHLLAPESLDCSEYFNLGFDSKNIVRLPDMHFEGIAAYNKMLCSQWFYQLFDSFDYLFVLQNDAWVFRDELEEWLHKGYDYIGAPWLWKPERVKTKNLIELWPLMRNQIGNGGVSLRRISYFIQNGRKASLLYKLLKKNEDFIWLLTDRFSLKKMHKPKLLEALHFCIEMEPVRSVAMIGYHLPFTTHAYERYGADFWKSHGVG